MLMGVSYTDLEGRVVVMDPISEDAAVEEPIVGVPGPLAPPPVWSSFDVIDVKMTFDDALASVLQVLPDIDPNYVRERFDKLPPSPDIAAFLLAQILEEPYPRLNRKRKAREAELDGESTDIDYASTNRPLPKGPYKQVAYELLCSKFPSVPANFIRANLARLQNLYAPTFIFLHDCPRNAYTPIKVSRTAKRNSKHDLGSAMACKEFADELAWVEAWVDGKQMEEEQKRRKIQEEEDAEAARQLNYLEHEEGGGLLECGCCFTDSPVNFMTACTDGHLFCLECAKKNAETTVGNGGFVFKCMDMSGCKAEFLAEELAKFVDEKISNLRNKLEAGEAVRVASIEGFTTCPFCDFGAIIEDENDKEFRCQNQECKIVSCRFCREESHVPLSCEEHKKDKKQSAKHVVEEAMSAALIQTCNKCKKPFIKEYGCNKMSCSCGNLQCYICGQSIRDYSHFDRARQDGSKCPLNDDTRRLETKIRKAQEEAVKRVLEETDGVSVEDLNVDTGNVKPPNAPPFPLVNLPFNVLGPLNQAAVNPMNAFVHQVPPLAAADYGWAGGQDAPFALGLAGPLLQVGNLPPPPPPPQFQQTLFPVPPNIPNQPVAVQAPTQRVILTPHLHHPRRRPSPVDDYPADQYPDQAFRPPQQPLQTPPNQLPQPAQNSPPRGDRGLARRGRGRAH